MCAILLFAAGSLCLSVASIAGAATTGAAPAATSCAAVKYTHVLVLTSGDVKLAGNGGTVTGQYGAAHGAGAGYGGYYLPAGAKHTLSFAAPQVCLTATATTTTLSPSSLAALKNAVDKGPYNFYGIVQNKAGGITRIDQLPALAMSGDWEGTYVCSQGLTGLDLRVTASQSGKLTAFFDFYPVTKNPTVPSGSFVMTGSYNAKRVSLSPGKWLAEPAGYETVGLSGVTPGFNGVNTFRGSVLDALGCTTFLLHRLTVAPDEAATTGKWQGTYVCSQGLTGLTLTIKSGKTVDTTMHTLTATFAFHAVAANPGVPTGSYSMKGYYFPGGIDLAPNQWISNPGGYNMVGIVAVPPAAGGKKLKGVVVSCPGTIDLARS